MSLEVPCGLSKSPSCRLSGPVPRGLAGVLAKGALRSTPTSGASPCGHSLPLTLIPKASCWWGRGTERASVGCSDRRAKVSLF